ncbi:flavin-containing monooxygenase [Demetria terragena]|uniref:flavin-containing monooxygenase n=1 Tax=Demetria terragena TaxID=63959 RepID=UPI000362DD86|nr:NAD(P)/FAD-dependent oxidoreductase [Demetria terragena]
MAWDSEHHEAVIVGTGFSGIAMGIALRAAGREFVMLEKAAEVGGVWRDNRYPGCASDVPAHLYSYSFEPNPYWSQTYAPSDEIQDYLLFCVEKYHLRQHIHTGSTVQQAIYNEATGRWTLTVASAWGSTRQVTTDALILGIGALHEPVIPEIPGLPDFAGEVRHTAAWDPGMSVLSRRVGVIGTGSSGVQVIPPLAEDAEQLSVFQRSPAWVLPRGNEEYTEEQVDRFERHPSSAQALRAIQRTQLEARSLALTTQPALRKVLTAQAKRHLQKSVADKALRAKLTPSDALGCKRFLMSDAYYPALMRDTVEVVTDAIDHIEPDAIVTASGQRHHVDVLVLATGFDPVGSYRDLSIAGLRGRVLGREFARDAETYLGVSAPHFPNLFMLLGPNTLLGHSSEVLMVEAQVALVTSLLAERERRGATSVAVRPEIVPGFLADIDRRSARSAWRSGCTSWYLNAQGHNRTLWPGSVREYEKRATKPEFVDYVFA